MKLADSATHETTIAGLMVYSKEPGCDGFADTGLGREGAGAEGQEERQQDAHDSN